MSYIEYDATIIQEFAAKLYRQAQVTIVLGTIVGLAIGAAAGAALAAGSTRQATVAIAGALLLGALALAAALSRAFQLRLQAQMALCQLKIEENTRNRPPFPR